MSDKFKPTDIDIANIANAYCRLQMGVEKCGECTGYKNEQVSTKVNYES